MARLQRPHRLLIEAATRTHHAATPRLRMEPTGSRRPLLDGGWWPRSTDPLAELPGLVLAIETLRGPVTRLLLSASGWDRLPQRLQVADRVVQLSYFSSQPASLLTALCESGDRVDLLLVAPDTGPGTAQTAIGTAATTGDVFHTLHVLRTATPVHAKQSAAEDVWEDDGGGLVSGPPK